MKIALLGYDLQGRAAYEYWNQPGNTITVCDRNTEIKVPDDVEIQLGDNYLEGLGSYDLLVRTPGLHPRDIVAANPDTPDILEKVTTVTNEFMRVCPTGHVVGVTGTKGKGTTSSLITKILEADGKKVHLGGNIGIPPLELLKKDIQPSDWVVLELANFQTIDIKYSPHIGVCLMIVAEHLNWHADMAEYVNAKRQLFLQQNDQDIMVYNADDHNSIDVARSSRATKFWYRTKQRNAADEQINEDVRQGAYVQNGVVYMGNVEICKTSEIALLGEHNWQNVCAAIAATWHATGYDKTAAREVVTTFRGLPFRIELRREKDGIRYYNDSFASQPDATIAALRSIPGKKVMIMGGFDRGLELDGLCEAVQAASGEIRRIVIIGASGERLAENLTKAGFDNFVRLDDGDMQSIVELARSQAEDGDAVVLSPGFASFDMFKNFEDRGRQFNQVVNTLR